MSDKARRKLETIETLRDAEREMLQAFYAQIADDMQATLGMHELRVEEQLRTFQGLIGAQLGSVIAAVTGFSNDYTQWRAEQIGWRSGADQQQREIGLQLNAVQAEVRQVQEAIREVHTSIRDLTARLDNAEQALADVVVEREADGATE